MKDLQKRLLRKFGLYDNFELELTVSPQTFADKLSRKIDSDRPDVFDIFTFDKKEYKGFITANKFDIKKCQSFIVSFEHLAEAHGDFEIKNNKLQIRTEVHCTQPYMTIAGFALTSLVFGTIGIFIIVSIINWDIDGIYAGFAILTFITILLGLPTLVFRWSVKTLKWDLEDELKRIKE